MLNPKAMSTRWERLHHSRSEGLARHYVWKQADSPVDYGQYPSPRYHAALRQLAAKLSAFGQDIDVQ